MAADTKTQFQAQLRQLELAAAKSTSSCLVAQYIALSDDRVQALFLTKLTDGAVFNGMSCLSGIGIPEYKRVYFDFDCPHGTLCIIKPAFVVIVNIVDGTVVSIVDPYIVTREAKGDTLVATRGTSLEIDISTRWTGSEWCVKVKVKVKVSGLGSGTVSLPEVCLGADGVCSRVDSGGGDVRAEAEVCWRGNKICAEVTGKIKLFGTWYEDSATKCVDI
jgi:hypothetical protein